MKISKKIFGGSILPLSIMAGLAIASAQADTPWVDPYADSYEVNTVPDSRYSRTDYRPGELIVKLKADGPARLRCTRGRVQSSAHSLDTLLTKYGADAAEELMPLTGAKVTPAPKRARALNGQVVPDADLSALYVVRLDPAKADNLLAVAEEFAALPDVEYAEPNYRVYACVADASAYTSDPLYSQQWGIPAIKLDQLWAAPVVSDKRPVIAILDTGVDIEHPDLKDNIWTNALEADGSDGRDDDANGFVDDIHGWDFVNKSPRMRDKNGHGTHCAGIAAAVGGNGIGITGANPDALIMPITVMQSDGTGDVATIIKGIDYAAANGADVISMSFGGYSNSLAEYQALGKAYQKAVLVAAAGNDNRCIYPHFCPLNIMNGDTMFPAAYNFVLGVEASANPAGWLASFSNFDEDGPITSTFADLYNYELRAPGTNILSTFPGGQYKTLNGTSMACPLAAGAISRLMMTREVRSKEELFGDLIYTAKGNIDIFSAYSLTDADRIPTLSLVTYRLDDAKMGDGDGRPDAGETIRIYPTFRNSWGLAQNITYSIRLAENEDTEIVEFLDNESHFNFNLSSYASAEAESPFILKISPNCVDGRHISLVLTATCDNITTPLEQGIVLSVENCVELCGLLKEDMILTPDKNYIVTGNLRIPEGINLTILPGTTIKCRDGSNIVGYITAIGEPGNMIRFTSESDRAFVYSFGYGNPFAYCIFENLQFDSNSGLSGECQNCIMQSCIQTQAYSKFYSSNIFYSDIEEDNLKLYPYCNYFSNTNYHLITISSSNYFTDCNIYNNHDRNSYDPNFKYSVMLYSHTGEAIPSYRNYFGSGNDNILQNNIINIFTPGYTTFADFDYSTKVTQPVHEAHGIVWKVVVNDCDAQDEYELLPPLGVGRHKFEVYFNRKMNHDKAPVLGMGVRKPYTQVAISEDGEWRTEMMKYNPLGNGNGQTNVINGDFNSKYYDGWRRIGCDYFLTENLSCAGFDGGCMYSDNHQNGKSIKMYQQIPGAQNGRYKLTISVKVDKLAVNNNCQYVYLNDSKTYLEENALNGAVYEVIADVRDNFIEVGIEQTENVAAQMYIDNVSLTLLEEYSNERLVPVDIYTAYLTIKGKDNFDGVNTIYVAEAEDDEFFEIPIEDVRFHVNVQSAGSMSSGFVAEPGVGKVTLTWENPEENFDDMLGYNMYRYTLDENNEAGDTVRINERLLNEEELIDYDIVPGTTYCYYYKVLRTSLEENSPSRVVSATPRAAGKGDANASGDVDVADVVTEVNYMVGLEPKPFMFEAADVNDDKYIDILDVVGTVNIIMKPAAESTAMAMASAVYTIENGILYVDCTTDLAGLQVDLSGERGTQIRALDGVQGMETTGDWISDSDYRFIAFSLSGHTVQSGLQAILAIGDATVEDVILVDQAGNRVAALLGEATGISSAVGQQMRLPYPNPFADQLNVPVTIATDGMHKVEITLTNLAGASVAAKSCKLGYGEHIVTVPTAALPAGFYIVTLTVDGKEIQAVKAIKR